MERCCVCNKYIDKSGNRYGYHTCGICKKITYCCEKCSHGTGQFTFFQITNAHAEDEHKSVELT